MTTLNTYLAKTSIALSGIVSSGAVLATTAFASAPTEIDPGTGWVADIGTIINFALNFIMVVAILLVFFYLIWGGIQWITSGGDKGKTEEARNKITAAVVGIIVLAAAYALVSFVMYILGFSGGIESLFSEDNLGTLN